MEFAFTPEEEQVRAEVQAFIREQFTPEVLADLQRHKLGRGFGPRAARILERIRERGWVAYSSASSDLVAGQEDGAADANVAQPACLKRSTKFVRGMPVGATVTAAAALAPLLPP